ncbi:succinate dehydrogenase, cytochrome b556 subunit [Deinococcus hohokamensis]|uniref:Succinate dehydrogenase, cytochrome b556 subunit n=1 Tax=Deinococcus hohokamensis TaxID=309883 RepID=A0ABV9I3C5_9DEIO
MIVLRSLTRWRELSPTRQRAAPLGSRRTRQETLQEDFGMYRGREGQWAFLLHRLSGLAILAYLLLHVFSIGSHIFGERFYMAIHETYDLPFFRVGLIFIVAGVVYHSFNGLRIIVMDFTGAGVAYQRQMWYAVMVITVLATLYSAFRLYPRLVGGY